MRTSRRPLRAVVTVVVAAIWATTTASAYPANDLLLFGRQSSTCAATYSQCDVANFPNYFCCPTGQNCLNLAGNTTLLCCPSGADCSRIQPISCDITQQDGKKNPTAVIKTTALKGTLGHCGEGTCCPFGYSCTGDGQCQMNANQNAVPFQSGTGTGTTPTVSTSPSSSVSSSSSPSSTGTSSPDQTGGSATGGSGSSPTPSSETGGTNEGPAMPVIIGASVGAALFLLAAGLVAWVLMRKRKSDKRESSGGGPNSLKLTRSTSSFGNIISNPIMAQNAMRTDFVRGAAAAPQIPPIQPRYATAQTTATATAEPASVTGAFVRDSVDSADGLTDRDNAPKPSAAATTTTTTTRNLTARQSSIAYGYGAPQTSPYANYINYSASNSPNRSGGTPDYSGGSYGEGGGGGYGSGDDENELLPRTPTRPAREPSSVSINVFADPRTITPDSRDGRDDSREREEDRRRRISHLTTFTQMMEEADLGPVARGQSYVPYNGSNEQGSPMPRRPGR
ncbi:hypothetical protein QBC46DRAFT_353185 [Diplogelasinospora grovesii]|uniref:Mid2 domain-containing protein n=1 Tax=Diplogelasinospora grovesii TaxID=303347 RepID=A0AAN6N9B1_9PEZI|nr:hypothetical protein QBC46DRAFT_353185 [Diplogelasinospora grovesii]